jgi:hypothetical protein
MMSLAYETRGPLAAREIHWPRLDTFNRAPRHYLELLFLRGQPALRVLHGSAADSSLRFAELAWGFSAGGKTPRRKQPGEFSKDDSG